MKKYAELIIEDEIHKVLVVNSVGLKEERPDDTLIHNLAQKTVRGEEKKVFIKKVLGIIFLIAAIVQIISIFIGMFMGLYEIFDFRFFTNMIVFMILAVIGIVLFRRNKAVNPVQSFKKYWGSYLKTPNDFTNNVIPCSSIANLFYSPAAVIANLQKLYPISIEFNEEEISLFITRLSEVIKTCYPYESNESLKFVYGVLTEDYCISEINETLLTVEGDVDIFRYCVENPDAGNCLTLNVCMYFIKLGKYWAPVNSVPQVTYTYTPSSVTREKIARATEWIEQGMQKESVFDALKSEGLIGKEISEVYYQAYNIYLKKQEQK